MGERVRDQGGPYGLGGRNVNEIERARIIHDGQESLSKIAKGSELTLGHRCRLRVIRAEYGPPQKKAACRDVP